MLSIFDLMTPITWFTIAVIFGVMMLITFFDLLLWVAISSLCLGLLLFFFPEIPGQIQILLFAVLSVSAVVTVRFLLPKFERTEKISTVLNDPLNRVMGSVGEVVDVKGDIGSVLVDGTLWSARHKHKPLKLKEYVRVVGRDGFSLIVDDVSSD